MKRAGGFFFIIFELLLEYEMSRKSYAIFLLLLGLARATNLGSFEFSVKIYDPENGSPWIPTSNSFVFELNH
jgi:hypothetical protein